MYQKLFGRSSRASRKPSDQASGFLSDFRPTWVRPRALQTKALVVRFPPRANHRTGGEAVQAKVSDHRQQATQLRDR